MTPCANCGATLVGRYCALCGQDSRTTLTVRHFVAEVVEGLTHFDSSFWRTFMPLLFKPGALTARYLDGKRRSYMPPVRTYLILSIVYFLLLSASGTQQVFSAKPESSEFRPPDCAEFAASVQWLRRWIPDPEAACLRAQRDEGRALASAMNGLLPKMMFLVLPLVALVQYWLHRRRRPWYVEHLVFVLHFQSFFYLAGSFVLLVAVAAPGTRGWLELALYVWAAIYLFLATRRVYDAGRIKALLNVLVLAAAYTVFFTIGASIAGIYAFLRA